MHDPDSFDSRSFEPFAPGSVIGQYRIIDCLGSGGMGNVCLADDTRLNRKVALKFLSGSLLADENFRKRFVREAQAAAALNHPNIVTVHEVGEYKGRPFIAMEYVTGRPLTELIGHEGMEIDKAVEIVSQVCEGLAEAHSAGIIHRDLKPANIMLDDKGRVRILDFGLARSRSSAQITQPGSTPGTIAYMSPEQVKGEGATPQSDLFSVGVLMYHMLTGRLPFCGDYDASIIYSIVNDQPRPMAEFRADVPSAICEIVTRLLAKNASERYQSAQELLDDIRRIRSSEYRDGKERSGRPAATRFAYYAALVVVVALGLAVGLPSLLRKSTPVGPERKMLAVLPFENLGSAQDEYFADGMTDAITMHLAKFSGLGVISRTSSMLYKHSNKTTAEIGAELGAEYLLEGRIHWDKSQSPNRLKINTSLIRAGDNTDLWSESYERNLESVFALQSDIASHVTQALDITIGRKDRDTTTVQPTENLDAYDFYLRGNDYFYRTWDVGDIQFAIQMYKRAIALDSNFAAAWAMLARGDASMYWEYYDRTDRRRNDARQAADRALALKPDLVEGHLALGYYYYHCMTDHGKALEEFNLALKYQPNNADLYNAIAAVQRRQGNLEQSAANFVRALELDPRSHQKAFDVALTFGMMRQYSLADHYLDRTTQLAPDWPLAYIYKAWLPVVKDGNVTRAREVLAEASGRVELTRSKYFWWLLRTVEPDLKKMLPQIALGSDTAAYFLQLAQVNRLMGNIAVERLYADSARLILEPRVQTRPDDARFHSYLGLAYAGLRRKAEAIAEGQKAIELLPTSQDAFDAPFWLVNLAETMVIFEEYDAAIRQIQVLLSIPGFVSAPYLKLDPLWIPLRDQPGFKKLISSGT